MKDVRVKVWRLMRKTRVGQPGVGAKGKRKGTGIASSEGVNGGEGSRKLEDRMDKLTELLAGVRTVKGKVGGDGRD